MTYGSQCRVVLSSNLHEEDKVLGLTHLLVQLGQASLGESGVYFWNRTDDV